DVSDKIFDLLFTTKANGTGLGLSICKNIISSHDGSISFSNNPTTFTIKLPRK
ncbi:MAG: ATP-binding protein, partial [Nitrosopumilaceae archaeon]|nr:ATP-binding protein [Nitrosopumilaceae archaeon]